MFSSPKILISYNARLRRARVQFTVSECLKSRQAPIKQLAGIKLRFEQEKEDGHIEAFALFTKRFEELWQHIRRLEGQIDPKQIVKMTIGQGGRLYQEIVLTPAVHDDHLARLSCSFSAKRVQTIPFNAFVFNIMLQIERFKINLYPDRAQLRFLYLLLKNGQKIENVELKIQPQFDHYGKSLLVQLDQKNHYATLHLFDPRLLTSRLDRERTWKKALLDLNKLNKKKLDLTILKEHSLEKLESLAQKMQSLGFAMPYDLLIAYDASYRLDTQHLKAEKALALHEQPDLPRWKMRLGTKHLSDYFQIDVHQEGMTAKIVLEHKDALSRLKNTIDLEWIVQEFAKQGIVAGYEPYIESVWKSIQAGHSLVGTIVAKGTPARPGQNAYLHLSSQDQLNTKAQKVDVRESQNRNLAKQGDLIAEVRFSDGLPGQSVRGDAIHALGSAAACNFQAGDGVTLSQDCRFYARKDGLVTLQGNILVCESVYIHKGAINMSSGNLAFEGAVVVQGDIDSGASVSVRGQLIVEGMIGSATVRCSGDLEVKGGIVTGQRGWVHAGGQIRCNFIENSEVQSRGGLQVQRSILNSSVIADGPIVVTDARKGLIAGGTVSSWTAIRTAVCGMAQGSMTECRVGSNFAAERRLKRSRSRLKKILEFHSQLQKSLKEFEAHKKAGPAGDAQHALKQLQAKVQKAERIAVKLGQLTENLEQKMQWNAKASLIVNGVLDKSTQIIAAGRRIPLTNNLQGVIVAATPYRGSHLVDLEELAAFQQAYPDLEIANLKKAG